MSKNGDHHLPEILAKHETMLLSEWLKEQLVAGIRRDDLMREGEMRDQSGEFLRLLRDAIQGGNLTNFQASEWNSIKALLTSITRTRVQQGSSSQVAFFIFSLVLWAIKLTNFMPTIGMVSADSDRTQQVI